MKTTTKTIKDILNSKAIIIILFSVVLLATLGVCISLADEISSQQAKNEALEQTRKEKEKEVEELLEIVTENQDLIYYANENKKARETIVSIDEFIEEKQIEKTEISLYEDCTESQIERILSDKDVDLTYCLEDNETFEEVPFEEKEIIPAVSYKDDSISLKPWLLYSCIEVGANDPYRCATYWTLVYNYESGRGESRRCKVDNNCFGIKEPTDKSGIVWDWKVGTGRHLIFETQEMGGHTFAYYYAKYHEQRNAHNFVNRWAGWNNIKYIGYIKDNYDDTYSKYQKVLTIKK